MLARRFFSPLTHIRMTAPAFTFIRPTTLYKTSNLNQLSFGFCTDKEQQKLSQPPSLVAEGKEKLVGFWLFLCAAAVLGMIVLGGYTRLTHSGLSMADWSPYTKRYPKNDEEW